MYLRVWTRQQFHGHTPHDRCARPSDNQRYYFYLAIQLHPSCFEPVYWHVMVDDLAVNNMDHTREHVVWAGSEPCGG